MILLRCYKVGIVIFAMLLLAACSSISGPVRLYEGIKSDKDIVKFIIPADLDILKLDGEKPKNLPVISDGLYHLELLPGNHRFTVVYSRMWGSDALGSFVESDAFYFDVPTTAGSTYKFKDNGPANLVDADNWYDIDEIKIWIEEQKTGRKIKALSVRAYGNILYRYITGNSQVIKPEVAIKKSVAKVDVNQAQLKDINAKELDNVQQKANEQLEFWWKVANAEQRKVFQDWLVTQKELKANKTTNTMQQKATTQLKFWWKLADMEQRKSFLLWVKK